MNGEQSQVGCHRNIGGGCGNRPRPRVSAIALALSIALAGIGGTTTPQSAMAQATSAASQRQFSIPAGSLREALDILASRSGITVMYSPDLVAGKTTRGLSGSYTPIEALRRLLQGSGLEAQEAGDSTFTLKRTTVPAANTTGARRADTRNAPTAAQSTEPETQDMEKITVTGTHIRGVLDTATPSMVLDREDIDQSGLTSTVDLIATVPQNFASITASSRFAVDGGPRIASENFDRVTGIDLRGLGPESTLTLLNGTRRAGGALGRVLDVSSIPLFAIDRIEMVTGGRSAIYGSDAIGGVANIITRRQFDGAQTQVSYGAPGSGGGRLNLSQMFGFSGERVGAVAVYDYEKEDAFNLVDTGLVTSPRSDGTLTTRFDTIPESTRHSVYFATHALVGENAEFEADFLGSQRDSSATNINIFAPFSTAESPQVGDISTRNLGGSASLTVDIPKDWQLRFSGAASQIKSRSRTEQLVDFGDFGSFTVDSRDKIESALRSFAIVGDGPLFQIRGSEALGAIGTEWRREDYRRRYVSGGFDDGVPRSPTIQNDDADRDVLSIFGEINLPLLGERSGSRSLELSLAGRYDDYSDFGSTFNPQAGLIWKVIPALTLRAAYSEAYRAPALVDRLSKGAGNYQLLPDPVAGGTSPVLSLTGNNPDVGPEEAVTRSFTIDFSPARAQWLHASLSYFDIRYKNRIDVPAASFTDQQLALSRESLFPGLIVRNPTAQQVADALAVDSDGLFGNSTGVPFDPTTEDPLAVFPNLVIFDNRPHNIAIENVDGIDLLVRGEFDWSSRKIDVGLNATYTLNHTRKITAGSPPVELLNDIGKPVDLRFRTYVGVIDGRWSAFVFANYTDSYRNSFSSTGSGISSFTTIDMTLSFRADESAASAWKGFSASLSAINLLDADPPGFNESTYGMGYDPVNASPMGRFVTLQLRKNW